MNPSPAVIPKAVWIAAAAFASVIVVLLAAVLYKLSHPGAPAPVASAVASAPAGASAPQARLTSTPAAASAPPARRSERRSVERRRVETRRDERAVSARPIEQPGPAAVAPVPAPPPVCRDCGTVVAVTPEQVEGQANGAGAVIGGVLGGILGHQVGGGNGQTAATVLGAIGGGLAGNEVQKRVNAHTVYRVEIRMDDGATRSMTLASPPPTGTRVRIGADGSLQPAP